MSNSARDQMNLNSTPPPPPPEIPGSKISSYAMKLRTAPSNYFFQAPNLPQYVELFDTRTGPYFFYGTLTDPSMVRDILGLETEPELLPARLLGYQCKLWGQYPTLLDAPDSEVEGAVYHVKTVEHGERLAAYETKSYQASPCRIHYTDGKEPADEVGYTFKFEGNKKDLSDGNFDLRIWLKRMGRLTALERLDAKKSTM
ncbi:hypothetical protein N7530_005366 [Penicillium desertorum]|uniref:Putative gamma-glutamylcyclotransferase n=1 Tax=Penicillium desertorum TaxID=1303715 RepID=A0A9X0BRL6_9EURO|nr:hypothetical protein N7530_005366 [Penicillium desertorum]